MMPSENFLVQSNRHKVSDYTTFDFIMTDHLTKQVSASSAVPEIVRIVDPSVSALPAIKKELFGGYFYFNSVTNSDLIFRG